MGYTTEFDGKIDVCPPLSADEIAFLKKFAGTRRMDREKGPYFVDGSDGPHGYGQGHDSDIRDYNSPPTGQPGLWCKWVPTEDGTAIEWNGHEKFYDAEEWMRYMIEHFLKPGHIADMPFLGEHKLNGRILAQGEDIHDRWELIVEDNVVSRVNLR